MVFINESCSPLWREPVTLYLILLAPSLLSWGTVSHRLLSPQSPFVHPSPDAPFPKKQMILVLILYVDGGGTNEEGNPEALSAVG